MEERTGEIAEERMEWEGAASAWTAVRGIDLLLFWTVIWLIVPLIRIIQVKSTKYKITNERIVIREGIFTTRQNQIELFRIRDLAAHQSFMQKLMKVGDVTVISSDTSLPRLTMSGLPHPFELKEQIRKNSIEMRKRKHIRLHENF
jgi:uncharacterized membrane protein YdbT with pleckstrin-like domain